MRSGEVTTVCHIQCSNIHPIWPIWLRHKIWRTNCWNTWTFFSLLATPTSFSCYTTVRTFLDTHVCVCTPTAKVIEPFGRQHFTCYSLFSILQVLLLPDLSQKHWKTRFHSKYLGPASCCLHLIWIPKNVLPGPFEDLLTSIPNKPAFCCLLCRCSQFRKLLAFGRLGAPRNNGFNIWPVKPWSTSLTSKHPGKLDFKIYGQITVLWALTCYLS